MKRKKQIVVLCHCILNCNSKVEGLSEFSGSINLVKEFVDCGIGMIQLPCPEMMIYGIKRWGHSKEQFDNLFYKTKCEELLTSYMLQFENYLKNGYDIKCIVAIDGSPSCGYNKTCSSKKWYGELSGCYNLDEKLNDICIKDEKGMFIEVLISMMQKYNIDIPIIGLDESNLNESSKEILNFIKK